MEHTDKSDFKGRKAILVDDDLDFLTQCKLYLKNLGFKVITGESQAEGEKLIENESYDLAIFDLMMENQDSGFILSYKSKKKNPDVPVLLATAVTSETGMEFDAVTEESREWIKADTILDKGIRSDQLEREIDRVMKG